MQTPFSHTLPRLPHTITKLQKSRHWFRRDQRSVHSNLRIQPVPANHTRLRGAPPARTAIVTSALARARPWHPGTFPPRPASGAANPQPTLSSRYPEPALQSSKPSAGQFQQILHACEWGVPSPPACAYLHTRPWLCAHFHSRAHIHWHAHDHGHIHSRACSHLHGHGASQPDETSGPVHTDQAPTQLTQMPCGCVTSPRIYASNPSTQIPWGAWASTSTTASMTTTGGPNACVGPA